MTEYERIIERLSERLQPWLLPFCLTDRQTAELVRAAYAEVLAALSENPPEGALDAIPNCEGISRNSRAVAIWRAQLQAAPHPPQSRQARGAT